jgi:hypothetical protein
MLADFEIYAGQLGPTGFPFGKSACSTLGAGGRCREEPGNRAPWRYFCRILKESTIANNSLSWICSVSQPVKTCAK